MGMTPSLEVDWGTEKRAYASRISSSWAAVMSFSLASLEGRAVLGVASELDAVGAFRLGG